jgi:outer membrane protein assembly factor BamB
MLRMLMLAVAALAIAGAGATRPTAAPDHRPTRSWWLSAVIGRLTPAQGLGDVVTGWGDAWMDDRWGSRLLRVDGDGGRVLARIPVSGRVALTAGAGAMWALQAGGEYGRGRRGPLLRIDPVTNHVTDQIRLRTPHDEAVLGFGLLAGESEIWVWGPTHVLRIDARTDRVAQAFAVPARHGELTGAVLADGGVLATTADGDLLRFGAGAGDEALAWSGSAPQLRAVTAGRAVLVSGGVLLAADPRTGRAIWSRPLGFRIGTVIAHGDVLLAHGAALEDPGDRLWAIDARTGRVLHSMLLPTFGTMAMTTLDGAVWITAADGTVIVIPWWLVGRMESR